MSGPGVGLGVFQYGIEKFYDKIPEKAFSGDTYKIGSKSRSRDDRRNSTSSKDSRRRDSRDDYKNSPRQGSRRGSKDDNNNGRNRDFRGAAAGAAGGAAAGYAADDFYNDYRQPAPRRKSVDDQRNYDYNNQGYQAHPNTYSQGDPNFRRRDRAQSLDGQQDDDDRGERSRAIMSQQDQRYPPPRANDYHRYNPQDYRAQDQGYGSDYGPVQPRYNQQQDPYDRPQSTDDRRDRRDRKKNKSRSGSGSRSPSGLKGILKKNFEVSDTGLTSAALGALAGGLIGHEVGKKGSNGTIGTIAGALIGGLGANAWEARDHRKAVERVREDKDRERRRDESRQSSRYQSGDDGYNDRYHPQNPNGPNAAYVGAYGGQGRGYQSEGDQGPPLDSDEERRRRRAARRAQKEEMKRRAEMGDPSLPWGDILHT